MSRIESRAQDVKLTSDAIVVDLKDGRTVSASLVWYPRVSYATPAERNRWELIGDGEGIHWPDLDEDIEVEALVAGAKSAESQQSLQRWLTARSERGRSGPES